MQSCMMRYEWAREVKGSTEAAAHSSKLSASKFFEDQVMVSWLMLAV